MTVPVVAARFRLALALADQPQRPAAAWLLPGPGARAWLGPLGELARALGTTALALELWVVPGAGDGEPAGLLVVPPAGLTLARPVPPLAQPYGRAGARLLLPVDGRLEPEVAPAELAARLPSDPHLLHPAVGLVRLVPEACRSVLDLVAAPPRVEGRYRALEPPTAPLRLLAIDVEDPPLLEVFLRQGAEGVGEAPPSEAPPAPGEARGVGGWVSEQAARFVQWATGGASEQASGQEPAKEQDPQPTQPAGANAAGDDAGGGLFARLRRWSERALAELQDERQRELSRLVHLLETDPDQGLRYAVPLGDGRGQAGRRAPPGGSQLVPRDVDYRAGPPARGGLVDPWSIDPALHRKLLERYREVANRELRLGRYRRAAYVFAELLGDLGAAASALEQGRHHREAAQLLKDRLNRPLDAARCLERGGLLLEAVAIHEAEGRDVEAGDLWGRLDRPDEAARAYRRAVAARLAQKDPLSAARLLETKLDAADEALDVLAGTWPDHAQAALCLEDRLGLLGRLARHEQARRVLADLRQDARRAGRELPLARAVGGVASRYPEREVQGRAADLVRVLVGERLPRAEALEAEALLQALARLDPGDRLLGRDVGRMAAQRRRDAARARAAAPALRRTGWGPREKAEMKLVTPAGFSWRAAAVDGDAVWAAGVLKGAAPQVRVHRGTWYALRQAASWPWSGQEPVLLAPPAGPLAPVIVAAGQRRLRLQELALEDRQATALVGTPSWLPEGLHALAANADGIVWALFEGAGSEQRGLVLASFDPLNSGQVLGSASVLSPDDTAVLPLDGALPLDPDDAAPPEPTPALLVADRDSRAVLAIGGELLRFSGTAPFARWRLDRPPRDLALLHRPFAAAVAHDEGGRVYFDEPYEPRRFGEGLASPRIAFTPDGLLVAVSTDEGRVYEVGRGFLEHRGTFVGPGGEVLCVRATGRPREVVLVMKSGLVRLLEVVRA